MKSVRDALLVARFEVLRALRTWRAVALMVLYLVATAGGAYLFTRLIHEMEVTLADTLGVPHTDRAGAMLDTLVERRQFRRAVGEMVGDRVLVDHVLKYPVLAIFHLWEGLLLIPFFAASAAAEAVSIDMSTRALRFEILRTGRLELVTGRFLGQAILTAMASALGILGTWSIGMLYLANQDPLWLLGALAWLTIRAWAFSLPFIGLGVAASQLTKSSNWARALAIGGTAGSWVLFGLANALGRHGWGRVSDVALQILPQGWMGGFWDPGRWLTSTAVCVALGFAMVAVGYLRFARRDL